jgi:hypothetical protein
MAARRLLIVMLVLLGISSVIAVMVPQPQRDDSSSGDAVTGTTGATGESDEEGEVDDETTGETGKTVRRSVEMEAKQPVEVKAQAGSRMILTVRSKQGSDVEIEGLGLAGFADPYAPAVFDVILPEEPGRYAIRTPGSDPSAVIITSS